MLDQCARPVYKAGMTPEQITAIRTRAGLTIRQLAPLIRTDTRTIYHWEGGTRIPGGPATLLLEMLDAGVLRQYLEGYSW